MGPPTASRTNQSDNLLKERYEKGLDEKKGSLMGRRENGA
jgi:hypothetical protein